jgi:signal transduction histidine kinase
VMGSLQRFAAEIEDLFSVSCQFVCDAPVLLDDVATATHLFHIAQEAVNNAIKHGHPTRIVVALSVAGESGRLTIEDDGRGIGGWRSRESGMGLHIMSYRAKMIGGSLDVRNAVEPATGTIVNCLFPRHARV